MTEAEVREKVREACEAAGGQTKWAVATGVAPSYVSDVLSGRRAPGPVILAAIGIARNVDYVPSAA